MDTHRVMQAKKKKLHNYFKITMALRPPHFMVLSVYSGPIVCPSVFVFILFDAFMLFRP